MNNWQFNIRVYGLLVHNKKIMILKEPYAQQILFKFPGGGLEFEEGTIDCIKREFYEELNLKLDSVKHLYTTDYFQKSAFRENEQLISIYYLVTTKHISDLLVKDDKIQELIWTPINELTATSVSLDVDKKVIKLYKSLF